MKKDQAKEHYILYFDVLGYKKILQQLDDENTFLLEIEKMFNQEIIDKARKNYAKYKIFSDNAIIAFPKVKKEDDNSNRLRKLCHFASRLQDQCLRKYGILIRGSITKGILYIDDNFVYGSGLIRAYELENSEAVYPRVIIDPQLNSEPYISSSAHTIFKENIWDNYFFINFLNYYHPNINANGERTKGLLIIKETIERLIENETKGSVCNARILQKIFWLKQFLNYLQKNNECI